MSRPLDIVLEVVTGSRLYGTALVDSDYDSIGVYIEPPELMLGLHREEHRTEQHDDTDRRLYGLRKFAGLAAKGSPQVLEVFFSEPRGITRAGVEICDAFPMFVSKRIGSAFLGYLDSQRRALTGQRGARVKRPELVAEHGYDVKFAAHAIRLGMEGLEFIRTGTIQFPLTCAPMLRAVLDGAWSYDQVLTSIDNILVELRQAVDSWDAPPAPDEHAINDWLARLYREHWER